MKKKTAGPMKTAKKTISAKVSSLSALKKKSTVRAKKKLAVSDINERPLCVVGVGASGGGLEAVEAFLTHMPADSDVAIA